MKLFCDECREEKVFKNIKEPESIVHKGIKITVDSSYYKCDCGYEVNDPEFDFLEKVYEEYRRLV